MLHRKLALASLLIVIGAKATAQALLPRPTAGTSQHLFAANPHFVAAPEVSTDNGALQISGKVAGIDNTPVSVVLAATAITTCTNRGNGSSEEQIIQQVLTAARPHVRPVDGTVEFAIRTEPVEEGCADRMDARLRFRQITLTIYQNDRVVLEHVF